MSQDSSIEDREAEASRRLTAAVEPSAIYGLLADAKRTGTPIDGVDGLLNQMTKAVIEWSPKDLRCQRSFSPADVVVSCLIDNRCRSCIAVIVQCLGYVDHD